MNLLRTSLLALAVLFFVTSCTKDEETSITSDTEVEYTIDLNLANETDWDMANQILALVNEHRASVGLTAIQRDQQYASAYAVDHTQYMIELEQINHDQFGERSNALKSRGAKGVGENVAYGYTTAESLVTAWINSPTHRNVMEGNYTHSGFGVMKSPEGRYYFTQLFYKK